jgi:Ca-activated chloride channel homolog
MQATDVRPTRLVAARTAAKRFVAQVPKTVNVGVMALSSKPRVLASPTRDRVAIDQALDQLTARGGTGTGEAITAATNILKRQPGVNGKRPPSAIVLLSDGAATGKTDPVAAAQAARKLRIPIYTVALGTAQGTITVPRPGDQGGTETRSVPPDPQSLAEVAKASGGKTYTAADASKLTDVYKSLGSLLGTKNEKRQITAGFAGGAIVLLLLGAAMSLRWFGRLI